MISSTLALQNKVYDQRLIMHRKIKPNPAIFTQNAVIDPPFTEEHRNIWIENAHIGKGWRLSADNVVTGVPENDWQIDLPEGICIDLVPVDEKGYVVRPYGSDYFRLQLPVPLALSEEADRMQRIHNRMLRSRLFSLQGDKVKSETEEVEAFSLLRNGLIEAVADRKRTPGLAALPDQIVWGRSPIRIDLAGGWTDTPPFSLYAGGNVVNMAIELNGQPPLQVYVKPCKEFRFVLRSIDMGATEVVETYESLFTDAVDMAESIQRGDFDRYGKLILKTWQQNKALDKGTNPPEVERIIDLIKVYTLGYKLPGAGGGGYLYMVAKDSDAAVRIRKILNENRPNDKARFVEMQLSHEGFQVSRS
jgi:hypothetical protein